MCSHLTSHMKMKRVREIDLEAPVMDDDDDDGEEDGDSFTSVWDGRSPVKKSRWMHPDESVTNPGHSQSGAWPRDLGMAFDINGEVQETRGRTPVLVDGGVPAVPRSRPFVGIDLQLAITSESVESGQQLDINLEHAHKTTIQEVDLDPPRNGVEQKLEIETSHERRLAKERFVMVKAKPLTYSLSPATLVYSHIDRQDDKLHSFLEKQGALFHHADIQIRLEAARVIGERMGLVKEKVTRDLLIDLMQQQLWKEVEVSVSLALVNLLTTAAVVTCVGDARDDEEHNSQSSPSQMVANNFLEYIKAKDVETRPLKSALKLQILRGLYIVGKAEEILEIDSLRSLARDQLGSLNPKFRECGIRLLVASVRDKYIQNLAKRGGPDKHGRVALPVYVLKGWKAGESLMHSLLEYTRDPHPGVRETVVWGLIDLHTKGSTLDSDTYKHAVGLLRDSFECVRLWAIKLVGLCARELLYGAKIVDNAFLRICGMMTDMSMCVKQEVCSSLAEMTGVSEHLLLQSLSKKILVTSAEKESSASISDGDVDAATIEEKNLVNWSAGAFVVALEDEFWEVRLAAVKALAKLGIASEKMASGALELVADMINDVSSLVRHQTIHALTSLAQTGRLVITQGHLHMFLGVFEDSNMEIRRAGHDLLSSITLPSISAFQVTIRAILTSLEKHPEDQESLFSTLEKLGVSHASHTECITAELLQELRGLLNKESGLDEPQSVAIIVLLLAAAKSNVKIISTIPTHILAITRLVNNRLRNRLSSLIVEPTGFKTMRYTWFSEVGTYAKNDARVDQFNQLSVNGTLHKQRAKAGGQDPIGGYTEANGSSQERLTFNQGKIPVSEMHQKTCLGQAGEDEILNCTRHVVAIALDSRPLIEIRAFKEILQKLSDCRKEFKAFKGKSLGLSGAVSFCGLYLNCLVVVVQLLANFSSQGTHRVVARKSALPQDLLRKLESGVKHLLYRFLGLSHEQLVQIYELYALVPLWKLALHPSDTLSNDVASSIPLQELGYILRASKRVSEDESTSPSILLRTIEKELLKEEGSGKSSSVWRCARDVALSYWPSQMSVVSSVKEVWADMKVSGSDFDHRVEFVPGLPLGICVDITLHNVPESSSLWIQFVVDSSAAQYRYLDMEGSNTASTSNICQFSTILQLDNLPSGASCVRRICIVLEGMEHERSQGSVGFGRGPKGSLVPLCTEKEANLVNLLIKERSSKLAPQIRR